MPCQGTVGTPGLVIYFGEPKECIFTGNTGETTRDRDISKIQLYIHVLRVYTQWTILEVSEFVPQTIGSPIDHQRKLGWFLGPECQGDVQETHRLLDEDWTVAARCWGGERAQNTHLPTTWNQFFFLFFAICFFFSKKPCFSNFFQHFFGGFGDVLRTSAMIQGHPFVGPGCEIQLPLRFDKVCVYPGHKVWIIPWFLMMGMIFLWYSKGLLWDFYCKGFLWYFYEDLLFGATGPPAQSTLTLVSVSSVHHWCFISRHLVPLVPLVVYQSIHW